MPTSNRFLATRWPRWPLALLAAAALVTCEVGTTMPPADSLEVGTWGGEGGGVIVEELLAHVHIGCTNGDFTGGVPLDDQGRFNVVGEYRLRVYPVTVGPPLPARFAGVVEGHKLTLTVAVNDTVEKQLVVLGPVTVYFGQAPQLGPCPICHTPGAIARMREGRSVKRNWARKPTTD